MNKTELKNELVNMKKRLSNLEDVNRMDAIAGTVVSKTPAPIMEPSRFITLDEFPTQEKECEITKAFAKGPIAINTEGSEMKSIIDESCSTLFAEFLNRFPQDTLVKTFEGHTVIVKHNDFIRKTATNDLGLTEVLCFLLDHNHAPGDPYRNIIYQNGIWAETGPRVRADDDLVLTKKESTQPELDKLWEEIHELSYKNTLKQFDTLKEHEPDWATEKKKELILEIFYKLCNLQQSTPVQESMEAAIESAELLIKSLER